MRDASSLGQVRSCGRSCKLGSLVLDAVHQSLRRCTRAEGISHDAYDPSQEMLEDPSS